MNIARLIPDNRRLELRSLARRSHQVVILAAITGAVTGLVVAGLDSVARDGLLEHVRDLPPWVIGILPGIGLLVSLGIRRAISREATPSTADEYIHAFHDHTHRLTIRPLIARMLAAVVSVGSGNAVGLEGPAVYFGATLGSQLQRRSPRAFRDADRRVLMVAGAAAGVAAIFKAPATGVVFALEVPYQDDLARRMLLPALTASACGYLTFAAIHGTSVLFPIDGSLGFSFKDLAGAVAIGIIAGIGARGFAWMLRRAKTLAANPHTLLITFAAGVAFGGLFALCRLLTGESLLIGPGYEVLAWAVDPGRSVWILLGVLALRCLATSASVAGGAAGGLFIPLVVGGALTGASVAGVVGSRADLTLFVVIGVAAFLGAGYRVPLAAVMFVAETTGRPSFVVPALLAAVAAELVMGPSSVTRYQRSSDDRPVQVDTFG